MNSDDYVKWFYSDPLYGLWLLERMQTNLDLKGKCLGCGQELNNKRAYTCNRPCLELFFQEHGGDLVEEFTG